MRRFLLVACGFFVVVMVAAAFVLLTNVFSARTWLAERALRSTNDGFRRTAAKTLVAIEPQEALEVFVEVAKDSPWAAEMFRYVPVELEGELAAALEDPDSARAHA